MSEDKKVYGYARPLPCVRDEYGEIKTQSVRQLLAKIDEELTELKEAAFLVTWYSLLNQEILNPCILANTEKLEGLGKIAEEAADTITAITTLCEALGIDAEMRSDAQRRVNEKNRERGRL